MVNVDTHLNIEKIDKPYVQMSLKQLQPKLKKFNKTFLEKYMNCLGVKNVFKEK